MNGMTRKPVVMRAITWLPPGGIERRLLAVAPRLRERGWDVKVICLREEGPLAAGLRERCIEVNVIPFPSRLSPTALRALSRHFRDNSAAVVHSHMYRSNLPATLAARMARVPAIFAQVHNVGTWESWRQVLTDRIAARLRTGTIAVSRAVQHDVVKTLRLPRERVPILYNGVDLEEFRPDEAARVALRQRLGLAPGQLFFLVPARLHPNKDPLGTLAAWERAIPAAREPHPVLGFAGAGKLEPDLREAIAKRGLEGSVRLLGHQDNMAEWYNAADCVVLASLKEGFSNAVVEALACGRPVIASNVGGNAEALDRAGAGWIHPPGDTGGLAAHLKDAILLGAEVLAERAGGCRERAQAFSLDALVEQTHRLYAEALGHEP